MASPAVEQKSEASSEEPPTIPSEITIEASENYPVTESQIIIESAPELIDVQEIEDV